MRTDPRSILRPIRSIRQMTSRPAIALGLLMALFVPRNAWAEERTSRVAPGLLVLYTFERSATGQIPDRSGDASPLNLKFEKSRGVSLRNGALVVTGSTKIVSEAPAKKIVDAVKQSGELTIEAWVRPQDDRQAGPARIVTLSVDPGHRNFTLG